MKKIYFYKGSFWLGTDPIAGDEQEDDFRHFISLQKKIFIAREIADIRPSVMGGYQKATGTRLLVKKVGLKEGQFSLLFYQLAFSK